MPSGQKCVLQSFAVLFIDRCNFGKQEHHMLHLKLADSGFRADNQAVRYESDLSVNESFGFETAVWIKVIYRMSTHVLCISMSSCQDFSHVTISHVLCFVELLQFAPPSATLGNCSSSNPCISSILLPVGLSASHTS